MNKSLFVVWVVVLLAAACQIEIVEPAVSDASYDVLSAQIEQDEETKTTLDKGNVLWSENDQIIAFMKSSWGHQYQIKPDFAGKTYADFSKLSSSGSDDLFAGMEWDHIVAYYPYAEGIECVKSGDNYAIDVELPSEQTYVADSFGNGSWPMVAVSEDNNITFKNVCGGIKLQLIGTQKIASITIQGKNNEVLSGIATVIAYTDGETKPFITMTGTDAASKSVTLNCGAEGIQLNETIATEFILALPPVVFTEGFEVTIVGVNGEEQKLKSIKQIEISRSTLCVMPEVTIEIPETDPEIPAGAYVNLSQSGTANSYIVSQNGNYKFSTVKGNSSESVGAVASAEVLWESFGTDEIPNEGDLVKNVSYENGEITFQTADEFREGNAVITAKDASGTILWSWHIWLTDEPQGQEYYNNAGTMMDRNLGATSATPGNVGALGLLYQWGRKDPFLGSSDIWSSTVAESTISWPSAVSSDSSNGTIAYATANPTTFIKYNSNNYDWHYTGSSSTDNTRWTTSESSKSIYDPCPAGWRVPDGSINGVWSTALGSSSSYYGSYDSTDKGMNFSGKFGSDQPIWYPASGYRRNNDGSLYSVGDYCGIYWSASPYGSASYNYYAYHLFLCYSGEVTTSGYDARANGCSVRCAKEVMTPSTPSEPEGVNLSGAGTANSYIVSSAGLYKFSTVKGNSSESVGAVASADVLWETYGTDETPNVGDLVKNAVYSDGYITFQTADTFKKGNAVIAAKDVSGTILWSWHIWLTDEPEGQEYYNNAGTMMDRNLGATSATPGDVGALGLLYQWGRKDPFLGSSSISENVEAASTVVWPSAVSSDASNGTISYATANPTTFISYNSSNNDWYYTGSSSTNNTLWITSGSSKSIYDPCPSGWRVPDGGSDGVWSTALSSSTSFTEETLYDSTLQGINFSGRFGSASTIWYPASGSHDYSDGTLYNVGDHGNYWSASPSSNQAYGLVLFYNGRVYPSGRFVRSRGYSVRCIRESK